MAATRTAAGADAPAQAGVVYRFHPTLDDTIRAHPAGRVLLARHLARRADSINSTGDRALAREDWAGADREWRFGARCQRAAQSVSGCKPVNPEDYDVVEAAWRSALAEQLRGDQG